MVTRTEGNTTTYALTLLQLTFVDGNEQTTEFTPLDTDVVSVVLHGATGAYTYSPTIVDNVLYFTDTTGSLPSGSYDAEVLIDREDGTTLRAMERGALLVVYADGDALAYSTEAKLNAQMFIVQSADTADLENRVTAIETSGLVASVSADTTNVSLLAADTTEIATLPTATTSAAGVMSAAQVSALENANAVISASSVVYDLSMLTDATELSNDDFDTYETAYTAIAAESATAIAYNGICVAYDFDSTTYTLYFAQYDTSTQYLRYVKSVVSRISGNHTITTTWYSVPTTTELMDKANVEDVPNSYTADTDHITLQHTDGNDTYDILTINAAGAGAGVMTTAQATRLASAALAPTLSVESTAPATLTPTINTYTRIDSAVSTMSITLPAISAGTFSALSIAFTSDTTPAVTFTTADGKSIVYATDFAIDAETTYEISALFNGTNWVLAYVTFD